MVPTLVENSKIFRVLVIIAFQLWGWEGHSTPLQILAPPPQI